MERVGDQLKRRVYPEEFIEPGRRGGSRTASSYGPAFFRVIGRAGGRRSGEVRRAVAATVAPEERRRSVGVHLSEADLQQLRHIAGVGGISVSTLVRAAVGQWLEQYRESMGINASGR